MWLDVVDLRDFYRDPLGQVARRLIRQRVRAFWPDLTGQRVLGLGYATPYLGLFRSDSERTLAFMPASQGVLHWPYEDRCLAALVDEAELPLPDMSMDRVLLVHALECTEKLRPMMREIWRVLSGSGRLLVIAPNRTGLWSRVERSPFGFGRPYSSGQLNQLLRENMFTPLAEAGALYVPPSHSRMMLASAPAWERIGARWFTRFAGVTMVEATKQIYATPPGVPAGGRRVYAVAPKS